ncbi:CHAT domain-containing protein [Mycena vulgaris]|nr:CHAT domain-containing protein [Mycena vulgaris]
MPENTVSDEPADGVVAQRIQSSGIWAWTQIQNPVWRIWEWMFPKSEDTQVVDWRDPENIRKMQQVLTEQLSNQPFSPQTPLRHSDTPIRRHRERRVWNGPKASAKVLQTTAELAPEVHSGQSTDLQCLEKSFTDRIRMGGDLEDLEDALKTMQDTVQLAPRGHPQRAALFHNLGVAHIYRYARLRDLRDLEAAMQILQESVDLTPVGDPALPDRLQNLTGPLTERFKMWGNLKDLETLLQTRKAMVDLTPKGDPNRVQRLQHLSESLAHRFQKLGDFKDLELEVEMRQEIVDLTLQGSPDRARRLLSLSMSFRDRYRRLGHSEGIDVALKIVREAVALTPAGHPDEALQLSRLAMVLRDRYNQMGDLKDLEAALGIFQKAVELTPEQDPERSLRQSGVGLTLSERYRQLGNLKDLKAAVRIHQEVLYHTPEGHYDIANRLQHLGRTLSDRYRRLGDAKDLDKALEVFQKAVDLTPEGHPNRARALYNLAVPLKDRYVKLEDMKDLDAAIHANQMAVALTPREDSNHAMMLEGLSVALNHRYGRSWMLNDLEAVIQTSQGAVDLTPEGHPDRSHRQQNLAVSLMNRYERLKAPGDLQTLHSLYDESFKSSQALPEMAWKVALQWASFAERSQLSFCLPAYRTAFTLLPEILWVGHTIPVRHNAITRLNISGATSKAIHACIKLSDLPAAVEFLEQGLATIFQQMLQLKTDVDTPPPDQAQNFRNLSSQLHAGTLSNPITVVEDRNNLIEAIRKQPGFEFFLRPKPYNVLCHASEGGPVVILTSHEDQCSAIIILNPTSDPVHIPLPNVTLDFLKSQRDMLQELLERCNVRERGQTFPSRLYGKRERISNQTPQECFEAMLDWLWTEIVDPVYQVLKWYAITNGRLWWLPTGAFTGLPLHASAPADEFIHSYTITLGSLIDGYTKKLSTPPTVALIGVTHTDSNGNNPLKGVADEVQRIISVVKEPSVQCLVGEQATVDAVKLTLRDCSWVHLACHGRQDLREPTKSHLQLYEGTLELETILRMPLSNAQFVFLAACQTAMGDGQLVNESFHLGGGFIAAGFRSAIGTMWSMNDKDGPIVAEAVYSHLFREGRPPQATETAEALKLGIEQLKKRNVPYERWVPFIHFGV